MILSRTPSMTTTSDLWLRAFCSSLVSLLVSVSLAWEEEREERMKRRVDSSQNCFILIALVTW